MNRNIARIIAILAVTSVSEGIIVTNTSWAADSDLSRRAATEKIMREKYEFVTRIRKAAAAHNKSLLKQLCTSVKPTELAIADAPDEETALYMLELGADSSDKPCIVCMNKMTPLQYAAEMNWTRLISALLRY